MILISDERFLVVTSWLDGAHVVFGKLGVGVVTSPTLTLFCSFLGRVGEVVEGLALVKTIEKEGSASGTPKQKITIVKSGTL